MLACAEFYAVMAIALLVPAQVLLAQDKYRGKLEILPLPFLELPLYLGFNRQKYEADPQFAEALWTAIRDLRLTPLWQRLAPSLAH